MPDDEDATVMSELAENMRFYGDMRFKQLTLFMAAMTAAAAGIKQDFEHRWWIALGALFITAVMWVMEVRSSIHFFAIHEKAPRLWPNPQPKHFRWLTATLAVWLLHVAFYAFWLGYLRICAPAACATFCLGMIVGLVLLIFSVLNYPLRRI